MMHNLVIEAQRFAVMETADNVDSPDFLVRSREEILRLLNGVMAHGATVSISSLNADREGGSSLLSVDESDDTLLLACPSDWLSIMDSDDSDNGDGSIMVSCVYEDSKIQFQAATSEAVDLDGVPVLRLNVPDFMWRFQRRRDPRYKTSGLKLTLNLGFLDSDAELIDFSKSGIGIIHCDSEVKLDLAEELRDCTLVLPGVGQITVDLTVLYQTPTEMPDGRPATRVGCQFTRLDDRAQQLITHYLGALAQS
jgi:c-di-GMP-binding flagellar brake protein YcgR